VQQSARGGAPGAGSPETAGRQGQSCDHQRGRGYPPGNLRGVGAQRRASVMKGRLGSGEMEVDDGQWLAVSRGGPAAI
jgi:hypothetical protein